MTEIKLSSEECERYARHLALDEIGERGQLLLKTARVLVVGAGGLGSPVAMYLAAAGVGTIGIIDGDVVDRSNLQRQIMHSSADIGHPKVDSAAETLSSLNDNVAVVRHACLLTPDNARDIIECYDFVVDATDNLGAKLLVNDMCVELGKPFSYGGISEFEGQTMTCLPGTSDLRDLFGDISATGTGLLKPRGPFGAIAGMLGSIQAAEVVKHITGIGRLLTGRLLRFDARTMEFCVLNIKKS